MLPKVDFPPKFKVVAQYTPPPWVDFLSKHVYNVDHFSTFEAKNRVSARHFIV